MPPFRYLPPEIARAKPALDPRYNGSATTR